MATDDQEFELPEGIDPEMVQFFLAAEEEEEEALPESEETPDEDPDLEVLREVVRSTLLQGADPELIDSVLSGDLEEDEDGTSPGDVDVEAEEAAAVTAAHDIYRSLLERNPEHDFEPTLTRVEAVMDILGDPQDSYPSIHVGGTNGKTSTTRMAAALLHAFGIRVGAFTSPHLKNVRERIAINGEPLSAAEFVAAWEDVAPYVGMVDAQSAEEGGPRISYFESLAIMALAAFADAPVDAAVIEVGMGGRWDATNVIDAGVVVINPISLDHTRWLGSTLTEIAFEKAQIIKDRSIAVVAQQEEEVLEVIERRALEADAVLWLEGRDWELLSRTSGVGGQIIDVRTPTGVYEQLFVPLHGEHQAHNAAAALVAAEAMMGGKSLPAEVIEEGFLSVRSPGRLEVVRTSPTVVIDAAHNPAGVASLRRGIEESFAFNVTIGLFSAMADKAIEEMLVEIEPDLNEIVLAPMGGDRAAEIEELKEIAEDVFGEDRVHVAENVTEAIDLATQLADAPVDPTLTRGIVAFGSIQFVGEIASLLQR
ncbi:bifunctional folylpolyglutamate synthase/dihydrofolate synthase [Actinomyces minihominis]|uniref:bifunctional folylpolyglutamate synthase/dihydrofolate synthase n=1 Tax=Actinomyces minihominis TaxID=2002838 RepID=UPI000C07C947|nr:folylpolyglutamate synthase/dihydrofolate synthase family protein [Actinomyces minihominis]